MSLVDGLIRLVKAFPKLPMECLKAMQSQASSKHYSPKKAKVTVHGPSRRKVLLTAIPPPGDGMLVPDFFLSSIRGLLTACCSTLVVEVVTLAYGGFMVVCDWVATQNNLYVICNGAIPIFPVGSCVMAILPTFMLYLKLVNVPTHGK